jgi:hypothetical protein
MRAVLIEINVEGVDPQAGLDGLRNQLVPADRRRARSRPLADRLGDRRAGPGVRRSLRPRCQPAGRRRGRALRTARGRRHRLSLRQQSARASRLSTARPLRAGDNHVLVKARGATTTSAQTTISLDVSPEVSARAAPVSDPRAARVKLTGERRCGAADESAQSAPYGLGNCISLTHGARPPPRRAGTTPEKPTSGPNTPSRLGYAARRAVSSYPVPLLSGPAFT